MDRLFSPAPFDAGFISCDQSWYRLQRCTTYAPGEREGWGLAGMFEWMENTMGELLISARQWSGVYLATLVTQRVRRRDPLHNRILLQQWRGTHRSR